MPPRYYDSRSLRDWWATIEERPDDRLLIGMFADFLAEREHPIAVAMRWAFDKNRRPSLIEREIGQSWIWVRERMTFADNLLAAQKQPTCELPRWIMERGRLGWWLHYDSCTSAWQNFCRRFVARMPKIGRAAAFFCEAVP